MPHQLGKCQTNFVMVHHTIVSLHDESIANYLVLKGKIRYSDYSFEIVIFELFETSFLFVNTSHLYVK